MKEYVWVIIAVIAILLFVLTCIGIGTFLWRMFRYRPRRVIRVSPTTAKPIQPVQSVESQYSNYANYLNNNDSMYNAMSRKRGEFSPQLTSTLQSEQYAQKENLREFNNRNWAARSAPSSSIDSDEIPKITNLWQKRQSRGFIDRDPPTEESRSDFLDPVDFAKIQEIYSESQVSYERRRPLSNIECTYQEDHRYFYNSDRPG
ncbi:unnamed protein product [Enterobius vermicularis]|uniref:Uncharacterized protein n=1 Tax=Enterobius vermicularis TaxID=51028 RepID=A0A0N4VDJ5_ENTVE|nr:unnamed protein product [Enterobius vermicularis]